MYGANVWGQVKVNSTAYPYHLAPRCYGLAVRRSLGLSLTRLLRGSRKAPALCQQKVPGSVSPTTSYRSSQTELGYRTTHILGLGV